MAIILTTIMIFGMSVIAVQAASDSDSGTQNGYDWYISLSGSPLSCSSTTFYAMSPMGRTAIVEGKYISSAQSGINTKIDSSGYYSGPVTASVSAINNSNVVERFIEVRSEHYFSSITITKGWYTID